MGAAPAGATGGAEGAGPRGPQGKGAAPGGPGAWTASHPAAVTLALAAVAVAARAVAWQRCAAMMNDGPRFLELAQQYAAGEWAVALSHRFHPLYPILIAAVQPAAGSWDGAAAAVSIVSGGVAVAFLYDFLRRSFEGFVPLVGALLFAVHPYAVPFSADVQSEGLYIALFLGALAFGWRALETPRLGVATLAGLLSGLAYLTRPEGLGVALATGLVFLGLTLCRQRSGAQLARVGLGLALGTMLAAGPYLVALERQEGELRLTRKKSALVIATLDEDAIERVEKRRERRTEGREHAAEPDAGWQRWLQRGSEATGDVAESARHAFRLDHWIIGALGAIALGGPLGLRAGFLATIVGLYGFVLLGLRLTAGYVSTRHVLPPLLPLLGYVAAGYVSTRHVLPPLLPLLGYVAAGVPTVGRVVLFLPRLVLWRRGPPAPGAALAVGLAILVSASSVMALRPQRQDRAAARAAAEWLAEQGIAERVAASRGRVAYYARADYEHMPWRGRDHGPDWVAALRHEGVRYVIVDRSIVDRYPGVGDETSGPTDPRLRQLHRSEAYGEWASVLEIAAEGAPSELEVTAGDAPSE
jgi:hypothetical protein